jgi:hypothetical protein
MGHGWVSRKRTFAVTPEPPGTTGPREGAPLEFVSISTVRAGSTTTSASSTGASCSRGWSRMRIARSLARRQDGVLSWARPVRGGVTRREGVEQEVVCASLVTGRPPDGSGRRRGNGDLRASERRWGDTAHRRARSAGACPPAHDPRGLAREKRLHQEVQPLRIEIDTWKTTQQVAAITGTDYFRTLQEKAHDPRTDSGSAAGGPKPAGGGSQAGSLIPASGSRGGVARRGIATA